MKNLTIALMAAAAFTSVGCKKKGGGAGEAMAKMGEFKDKMCACKDKKCADDVQAAMNTWSAENAKSAGDKKAEAPDEKTMKEMQEVGTKYGECMAKAMGGGDAPPPPPPEGSAAGSGSAAAAPAADAPKVGEGPVHTAKELGMLDLPGFPGLPPLGKARWAAAYPEKDGDALYNYMEGDKGFVSLRFVDCNAPMLKDYIGKTGRGDLEHCFKTPAADAAKVKTYPRLDKADDVQLVIKVGHVIVRSGVWAGQEATIKKDDIAKFLETVDFSTIEN